ncbi:hypothetical protein INT44_003548 [Umbelopsis vinacea]|uniref:Uncharacterized protein n=1 Tax=Umbelopsis vinacea TaxID=44442 RepID=A0A8H7PW31_9FUNG|nr:hypothetical protein INT44_003548 [Umbelopsis vinacea]
MFSVFVYDTDLENGVGLEIVISLSCMNLFLVYGGVVMGCALSAYASEEACHTSSYHHGVVQKVSQLFVARAERNFYTSSTKLELD